MLVGDGEYVSYNIKHSGLPETSRRRLLAKASRRGGNRGC